MGHLLWAPDVFTAPGETEDTLQPYLELFQYRNGELRSTRDSLEGVLVEVKRFPLSAAVLRRLAATLDAGTGRVRNAMTMHHQLHGL